METELHERAATGDQQAVRREKRVRHVAALGSVHDESTKPSQQADPERHAAPLARRDPDVSADEQHDHQTQIRRVEQMSALDAAHEFAGNGDHGRDHDQLRAVSPQQ